MQGLWGSGSSTSRDAVDPFRAEPREQVGGPFRDLFPVGVDGHHDVPLGGRPRILHRRLGVIGRLDAGFELTAGQQKADRPSG